MDWAYLAQEARTCHVDQRLLEVFAALAASGIQCGAAGCGSDGYRSSVNATVWGRQRRGEVISEGGVLLLRVYDADGHTLFGTSVQPDEPKQYGPELRDWIAALTGK